MRIGAQTGSGKEKNAVLDSAGLVPAGSIVMFWTSLWTRQPLFLQQVVLVLDKVRHSFPGVR